MFHPLGARWLLLALPLAFAGALLLRTVVQARALVRIPRLRVTAGDQARARAAIPGLVEAELKTADGLALHGWFAKGSRRDGIVLVHGAGGNRAALLPEAVLLHRRGHGVLLYDSRASSKSEGRLQSWGDGERADVRAAVDYLSARPDVDRDRIGAYGFSVGANAVALEAAGDGRVRATALGPVWTSLDDELRSKFKTRKLQLPALARASMEADGVDVLAVRPLDVMPELARRPLLLLSGTLDLDTPLAVMDRMASAAPGAERFIAAGAAHGNIHEVLPEELDRRLGGFFDLERNRFPARDEPLQTLQLLGGAPALALPLEAFAQVGEAFPSQARKARPDRHLPHAHERREGAATGRQGHAPSR